MKVVVAPDKFKGSLSAVEAGAAIARGVRRALGDAIDVRIVPMADGGEGTVAAFLARGFSSRTARVSDALGRPIEATYAFRGEVAVIEMSSASGLAAIAEAERDPMRATTYGTGVLLRAALDLGTTRAMVGVGGSATTDGGAGFLEALGARFLDSAGRPIARGGGALTDLSYLDLQALDPRIARLKLELACDVDAPLLGPAGAAARFGPQKGADAAGVLRLEAGLQRLAGVTATAIGKDLRGAPGAGAGGGFAFGCLAILGAELRSGADVLADASGLEEALDGAALCITGEGSIDAGTLAGKVVAGVAARAMRHCVPVLAFAGSVDEDTRRRLLARGFAGVEAIAPGRSKSASVARAAFFLEEAAAGLVRSHLSGHTPKDRPP